MSTIIAEYRASTECTRANSMRNHRYLTAPPEGRLHQLDERFANAIDDLHERLLTLLKCEPFAYDRKPRNLPERVIYLMSEGDRALYVGRTRRFRDRLGDHGQPSAGCNKSPFAFQLALEAAKIANDDPRSREELAVIEEVSAAFRDAKTRLRRMDIRFVEEPDPVRQALLEVYCSIALDTPYNDFDTH